MTDPADFNIAYLDAEVYADTLPPHYYGGVEDVDLVANLLRATLGPPPDHPQLRVLDLGCGAGRVTDVLAPYAAHLHATDKSVGMIDHFRARFPHAAAHCADTETVLTDLAAADGEANRFDLIGSFWSMSYPLLECFEETTAGGVTTIGDLDGGTRRASTLVANLLDLLTPGGHLIMLFFDAHTPEQRLVTRLWERVAPFPGAGRDFTWHLLHDALVDADATGRGRLTHNRLPGVAVTNDPQAARQWFLLGHLNASPQLINNSDVHADIDAFIADHTQPDGCVLIPSGAHLVDYHANPDLTGHLPPHLR